MSYYKKFIPSQVVIKAIGLSFLIIMLFACKKFEPERVVRVETVSVTDVNYSSCTALGSIIDIGKNGVTQHGFCWSISQNPTLADNKIELGSKSAPGDYYASITELSPNTTYYIKAFARSNDEEFYGEQKSCVTPSPIKPTVETTPVSNETRNTAQSGGNIIDDGGAEVTGRGVCWSTTEGPTISDSKTEDGSGTGSYTSNLTGLTPGTNYYLRAYATNSIGTDYGEQVPFTTHTVDKPTLTTITVTDINRTSASTGGNITSDGGGAVTARGVCWSISANPTTTDNHTTDGTGTGSFTSNITDLTPGTTYYVRAYATNSAGTAYGNQVTFITGVGEPTLTTTAVTAITQTSAVSGGNVTNDGGAAVTARGVCWSTSANPTTANSHTTDGSGTGIFTSNLTGLTPGTTYYVRAYATNSAGTAYGNPDSFTTDPVEVPTLTTTAVTEITRTTASSGGNITDDGGGAVTSRGVCWSTSTNPTTADSHTTDGEGTGTFTSILTGLIQATTYYVRAYATNSAGTAYGNQEVYTTPPGSVTDADGNVYQTIAIGTQTWMVANLKTTKYNNGTDIPPVTDNTEWINLESPGYCWYDNDEASYKDTYGALYNWYAVNTGMLCPDGWHVPTDSEWTALEDYLGGWEEAGGKLKETGTAHWNSPNTGASNESGFTALPGGVRNHTTGIFESIGLYGDWWSETEIDINTSWFRDLSYSSISVEKIIGHKEYGFSIRCIKD